MSHVKSLLVVALVAFAMIAIVNRVDFLRKIAYPAA